LKQSGEAKKSASFIAPDGALIAKGTRIQYLLHIPYFVMKIDDHREFNIMSEKSFSLRNQKFTLDGQEKKVYDACKELNMRDQKAVELARFLSKIENDLLATKDQGGLGKDVWT
jgi:hypothetical protein